MKILLVGGTGTIGKAIVKELGGRHELVSAGRKSGDVKLDMTSMDSIRDAFKKVGKIDAVVSAAGNVKFAPFAQLDHEGYMFGLKDKLMGQVNLVLAGRDHVADGGSFTLTGGVLDSDPIVAGSAASMVNGALNSFCVAAAIELPRGLRINCVSPGVVTESMPDFGPYFRGFESVPAARVALAYSKSVEGRQTGQVYRVV